MVIKKDSIEITPEELFEVEHSLPTSVSRDILKKIKELLTPQKE